MKKTMLLSMVILLFLTQNVITGAPKNRNIKKTESQKMENEINKIEKRVKKIQENIETYKKNEERLDELEKKFQETRDDLNY